MTRPITYISSGAELKQEILRLENQQSVEEKVMKEHFILAYNSFKPINLIKSIFEQVGKSEELKGNMVNTSIGLIAGILSKIVFQAGSKSSVKKLMGTALMIGITNLIAKNPVTTKAIVEGVLNMFKGEKET